MKVTGFKTTAVRVPYDEHAIVGAHIFLQLTTDEGISGYGWVSRVRGPAIKYVIDVIAESMQKVVGQDPRNTEALFSKLWARGGGMPGYVERAASCIDVALWDLKAKAAEQPLWQLLGGYRDRVPCYASWRLEPRPNMEGLAESASFLLEQGFTAMKWHTQTLSDQGVIDQMRLIRETVGPDVPLMIDVNQRWNVKQAISVGQAVEQYNPYWIEDPVPLDDPEGLRQVRDALATRICAGEPFRSLPPFRQMLDHRGVDVVMVDLDVGITGFMKVAHMAEAHGLPVVPHLATEVLAHCIAAVPNGLTVEYYPWAVPLWQEPLAIEDGMLVLPHKPGLGVELDEAALQRFAI
jgi:L-alanine-DL-glutamate epimerase-like enolase superfamily enzyme